jgi:hypothetical protein
MSKSNRATTVSAPAPVAAPVHPILQVVSNATVAAAKQARYAPLAVLANGNAVITSVAPCTKRGKSAVRYQQFYKVGLTVSEFVASYKASGLPGQLARADLRWDLQHGLITLQG